MCELPCNTIFTCGHGGTHYSLSRDSGHVGGVGDIELCSPPPVCEINQSRLNHHQSVGLAALDQAKRGDTVYTKVYMYHVGDNRLWLILPPELFRRITIKCKK